MKTNFIRNERVTSSNLVCGSLVKDVIVNLIQRIDYHFSCYNSGQKKIFLSLLGPNLELKTFLKPFSKFL